MSVWSRISEAIAHLAAGGSLSEVLEKLRTPPERSVAFTIAVISLGAKMAKADGVVTRNEVSAFREIFHIPPEHEAAAAKVFNLARQDVAGFDVYARKISAMFSSTEGTLCDLMEGLFHIAVADGNYHDLEDSFLQNVADIFGLSERQFKAVRARFVSDAAPDPYDVLGVEPGTPVADIRQAWRQLVRETHPDRMTARGLPEEAIRMAEKRLVAINNAWDEISAEAA